MASAAEGFFRFVVRIWCCVGQPKAVATMSFATIKRLAIASGLPMGEEQDTDRHAATARARGDLFFEDVSGGGYSTIALLRRAFLMKILTVSRFF